MAPSNLKIEFAEELILSQDKTQATFSLRLIFDRDMIKNPCKEFNGRTMIYARDPMDEDRAFEHLITKKEKDGSRKYIDYARARRLHWVKRFLEKGMSQNKYLVFSYNDPKEGIRTYIYHSKLKHVVILEPNLGKNEYYMITSYKVEGTGIDKILKFYENRLSELV